MAELQDLDPIDDNNTGRWPENMLAAQVNNSGRADEGMLARWFRDAYAYATSSGTSTAYSVSTSRTISSVGVTTAVRWRAHVACGAGATLTIGGTTGPLKKQFNQSVVANDIAAGQIVETHWDATNSWWQIVSQMAAGNGYNTFGLSVGDIKISSANTPDAGFLRLKETAQVYNRSDYPDLYPAMIARTGYPWGATVSSTTFAIPPAAGRFLRFAANDTSVDPAGARNAGGTQEDAFQGHYHNLTNTSTPFGIANGASPGVGTSGTLGNIGTATPAVTTATTDGTNGTPRTASETRGKNVAYHADMLAVPALVASGLVGVTGFAFRFNSSTSAADPGSGYFSFDAAIGSATKLYISETDVNGVSLATMLASLVSASKVIITKVGAPANADLFTLSSAATDNGAWNQFSISSPSGSGTISNGDLCTIVIMPAGATGAGTAGAGYGGTSTTSLAIGTGSKTFTTQSGLAYQAGARVRASSAANPTVNFMEGVVTSYSTTSLVVTMDLTGGSGTYTDWNLNIAGAKGTDGAGAGTVTSISPGSGLASSVAAGAPGSAITASGTLSAARLVNAQTGTTYTVADGDRAKLVTFSNASSIAVTLPQAGAASAFQSGWFANFINLGVGTVTITPATSTINGASSLALATGQGCTVFSDGTNYQISQKPLAAGTDYTALAFKTIAVSGQSDVVADSAADTLTLVAGTNVTITTNASTDTITIAASGGGGSAAAAIIPQNVGLAVSAAASALTISLKGSDGNDPSGSNIVYLPFRSATGTTGTETTVQVTAATSLTISSGSTLGVTSSTAFRIWVVAFNDAGTIRLGAVNCVTMTSSRPTAIFSLTDNTLGSSTAEGGAGAADSSGVIYTGTAVSSKAYRILGYLEWNTSGVTAGTWTTTNLETVQVWSPGMPAPGMPTGNRAAVVKTDTFTSTTTAAYTDITGFNVSITPKSTANMVRVIGAWNNIAGASNIAATQLVRGSTPIDVGDSWTGIQATSTIFRSSDTVSVNFNGCDYLDNPASTSSTTYKVQFYLQGDTYYFNRSVNSASSPQPRLASTIAVEEIMG